MDVLSYMTPGDDWPQCFLPETPTRDMEAKTPTSDLRRADTSTSDSQATVRSSAERLRYDCDARGDGAALPSGCGMSATVWGDGAALPSGCGMTAADRDGAMMTGCRRRSASSDVTLTPTLDPHGFATVFSVGIAVRQLVCSVPRARSRAGVLFFSEGRAWR